MIDYSKLIKALKDAEMYLIYVAPNCYASCEAIKAIREAAAALKAADKRIAELEAQMPKQGKWISDLPNELFVNVNPWKCSVCGKHQHFREDYCPNCGAKMRTVTDCHTLEEGER